MVFDVQAPGVLVNRRQFVKLEQGGNDDGLAVDTKGNLYVAPMLAQGLPVRSK